MIQITTRQKLYAAAAVILLAIGFMTVSSIRSYLTFSRLERQAAESERLAAASESAAKDALHTAERESARADILTEQLREIETLARKQDEELQKLDADTNSVRGNAERARRIRTVQSTAHELCEKLAALGHGCEE
ncbi:MAG TPA: hypothetical protein VK468_01375 [Pyrinomonadaceae bacterium]|nr:hypothetical protein [Pyrinomonadaceae bacterium]